MSPKFGVLLTALLVSSRRRALRFWTTIPHTYQMHIQTEFLISSGASDLWVCWAGRAHAVASTAIEQ
jgi:hypothetical protein